MADKSFQLHAVVAGYGMPGRAAADAFVAAGMTCTVIELNADTIARCTRQAFLLGDAQDEAVLRQAGVQRASVIVVTIPSEAAALAVTKAARELNQAARIITRCHFTSTGLEARKAGADAVLVEEQLLATAVAKLLSEKPG